MQSIVVVQRVSRARLDRVGRGDVGRMSVAIFGYWFAACAVNGKDKISATAPANAFSVVILMVSLLLWR
jgi:hypothetical protein